MNLTYIRSSSFMKDLKDTFFPQVKPFSVVFFAFSVHNELLCVTGGRFKKEIVVDGQSYLLLIRDEGGPPEAQVSIAYIELYQPNTSVSFILKKHSLKTTGFVLFFPGSFSSFCWVNVYISLG